jgi:hypothetical protein
MRFVLRKNKLIFVFLTRIAKPPAMLGRVTKAMLEY